eukprot:361803-Chlamydomonas_euryale.AAC.3
MSNISHNPTQTHTNPHHDPVIAQVKGHEALEKALVPGADVRPLKQYMPEISDSVVLRLKAIAAQVWGVKVWGLVRNWGGWRVGRWGGGGDQWQHGAADQAIAAQVWGGWVWGGWMDMGMGAGVQWQRRGVCGACLLAEFVGLVRRRNLYVDAYVDAFIRRFVWLMCRVGSAGLRERGGKAVEEDVGE